MEGTEEGPGLGDLEVGIKEASLSLKVSWGGGEGRRERGLTIDRGRGILFIAPATLFYLSRQV